MGLSSSVNTSAVTVYFPCLEEVVSDRGLDSTGGK